MAYRIPLGTLRRLTGHVHTPSHKNEGHIKDFVEFAVNECSFCHALARGFDEGYESCEAAQFFNMPLHTAMKKGN